eukprot:768191-Hanusia_phi.AAC.1
MSNSSIGTMSSAPSPTSCEARRLSRDAGRSEEEEHYEEDPCWHPRQELGGAQESACAAWRGRQETCDRLEGSST